MMRRRNVDVCGDAYARFQGTPHASNSSHIEKRERDFIFLQRGITNRRVQAAPMWWKLKGADMLSACASMCQHKSAYVIIRDTDMPEVEGGRYVDFSIVVQ